MGILSRAGRALSAQFDALLSRAESPDKSLELLVQSLEEHLRAARREVIRNVAAEKQLRRKGEELSAQVERWTKRAELAVRRDDDALARGALLQRKRLQTERERTVRIADEQRAEALGMKRELERMEKRLSEVKARKGTLGVLARAAEGGARPEDLGATQGDSPFDALAELEDRIDNVEVVFEAQREVDEALQGPRAAGLSPAELEAKFVELERDAPRPELPADERSALDLELDALKQSFRVRG